MITIAGGGGGFARRPWCWLHVPEPPGDIKRSCAPNTSRRTLECRPSAPMTRMNVRAGASLWSGWRLHRRPVPAPPSAPRREPGRVGAQGRQGRSRLGLPDTRGVQRRSLTAGV